MYGLVADGGGPKALAGRIDAIAYEGDRAEVVIDWKSDVVPDETDMRFHAGQLEDYLRSTGAARGALVYMTPGFVRWVGAPPGGVPGEGLEVAAAAGKQVIVLSGKRQVFGTGL